MSSFSSLETERSALLLQRAHLLDRLSVLETSEREQQREVASLRRQVEILEYGVRHERAMRMDALLSTRKARERRADRVEERKGARDGDEKEQCLLDRAKSLTSASRLRHQKPSAIVPQYFTLPTRLPASPLSPGALSMWRDYIQGEGRNTDIDVRSHAQRESALRTSSPSKRKPDENVPPAAVRPPSPLAAPPSPRRSPPSPPPSAGGKAVGGGILSGGGAKAKAALKAKKRIQFKDVDRDDDGDDDRESGGKERKAITNVTFIPPTPSTPAEPPAEKADAPPAIAAPSSPSLSQRSPVSAAQSASAALRSLSTYKAVRGKLTLRFHTAGVRGVAFSSSASASSSASSSTLIATASEDCTVLLWALPSSLLSPAIAAKKPRTVDPVCTFRHLSAVLCVALHVASGVCVGGTAGGEVEVWGLEGGLRGEGLYGSWGECQVGRKGGWKLEKPIWSVTVDDKGAVIAAACADGRVYVLDAAALGSAPLHTVAPPAADAIPSSLSFLSSAELLAGYSNGDVVVIDVSKGTAGARVSTGSYVTSVSVGPASTSASPAPRFLSGHADGTLRVHGGGSGASSATVVQGHTSAVTSVAVHPVDGRVATCGHDEMVRLWEVRADAGLRALQVLEPHATHRAVLDEAIHCVQWSEHGLLASAGADGQVRLFG